MPPAVFLDRDNTLILNDGDLGDPELVRLVDGVPTGLKSLRDAGFNLVVVTNQAGVARGRFSEEDVDAVHQRIAMMADGQARSIGLIDRFYYCPYHPEAEIKEYRRDHPWRKPHPGMILQAARDMGIELSQSWMVGDQERDVLAGRAAGCRTILVTRDAALAKKAAPTEVVASFADAVHCILHPSIKPPKPATSRNGPAPQRIEPRAAIASPPTAEPANKDTTAPNAPATTLKESAERTDADIAGLRRSISELAEEIRSDRVRRGEFTLSKMLASVCQLGAVLLAMLGLLQLDHMEVFAKWMIGAALVQLLTITLLLWDTQ